MAKKPATPDDVMTIAELKPLLRLVKGEGNELGCSVALTESREALILVSKKEKPRRVRANLIKRCKEAGLDLNTQSIRFGLATTSPDDETVLLIRINKGPTEGPLPLAIKKRTKLAGFREVIFTVDETLEHDTDEADPEAATQEVATQAAPETAPVPPRAEAAEPGHAEPPHTDPTALQLRAAMEKLAPRLKAAMAGSADLRQALGAAAKSFVALLNAGDISGARHSLEDIIRLLKQATPASGPSGGGFKQAHDAWLDAIGTVDNQLSALAQALKQESDTELADIAEFGLNAVTANHKVPLMAALRDVRPGTPEIIATSGPKALDAIRAFRSHIETDERVEACDENPFGVAVTIRATLGPALGGLEAALAA